MAKYGADLRQERLLTQRLATYGLAEMHIRGDGNCQFRSLADQLFKNPDNHKFVRGEIIKQLNEHRTLYESYVPRYNEYINRMKRSGEWGDHITLQAAADRFEAKISLVTTFEDRAYIEILPKGKTPTKELWLSFWSDKHYNSLYPAGEVPRRSSAADYDEFTCCAILLFAVIMIIFM